MLVDLNNFIKNRVTAKFSDLTSCLATEKHRCRTIVGEKSKRNVKIVDKNKKSTL